MHVAHEKFNSDSFIHATIANILSHSEILLRLREVLRQNAFACEMNRTLLSADFVRFLKHLDTFMDGRATRQYMNCGIYIRNSVIV